MKIVEILANRCQYLPLLLLGDEQEHMIDRYLSRGTMFALFDPGLKTVCIVTDEGNGILEVKNIATIPTCQKRGYGRAMLAYLAKIYHDRYRILQVGTGESPLTVPFYEKCGFSYSHRVPNFFLEHYDHPIYEAGVRLVDMVYFQKKL